MATRKKDVLDSALKYINGLAAIGTMIATIALIWSNCQTKEQLKLQRDSVDLQRESIENVDSNVVLLREQVEVQREAIEAQRDFNAIAQRTAGIEYDKYIEQNKPLLLLKSMDWKLRNDTMIVFFNITNTGKSTASDIRLVAKDIFGNKAQAVIFETYFDRMVPDIWKTIPVLVEKKVHLIKTELEWHWKAFNTRDYIQVYKCIEYDTSLTEGVGKELPEKDIERFWIEYLTRNGH